MLTQFVANNGVKQDKAGEVVASARSRKRGDIPSWEQAQPKWEWIIASKLIKPRVTPWRELDRTTTESTTPEVIMAIYRDELAKKKQESITQLRWILEDSKTPTAAHQKVRESLEKLLAHAAIIERTIGDM